MPHLEGFLHDGAQLNAHCEPSTYGAMLAHNDHLTCLQHAAKQGTRICFYTTRDPTKAVMLPANLLEFGERILPYDNAHFTAVPAGATSSSPQTCDDGVLLL